MGRHFRRSIDREQPIVARMCDVRSESGSDKIECSVPTQYSLYEFLGPSL